MAHRRSGSRALLPLALLFAACATPATGSPAAPTPASPTPTASPTERLQPPTPTSAPPSPTPTPTGAPTPPPPAGDPSAVALTLEPIASGFASPLFVTGAGDGSGRLFVVEQEGRVRIVRDGRVLDRPFLDIADQVGSGGERGLLGLTFPRGFGSPGGPDVFFVDYTDLEGDTQLAEVRAAGGEPDLADASTMRSLLRIGQPYANHNGGWVGFGPDGMLYAGLGDGGSGGDPHDYGQRLDTRLGKLLRIDVLAPRGDRPYLVPADNPLVGREGAKPEIWSYGLRNPWRASFDRATGDLWIGDVGQNDWEEIDRSTAGEGAGRGANFGWRLMEARHCFEPATSCPRDGLILPVAEYRHDAGCSVTGGYVYRGTASPALAGVYVFADYCSGTIWGLASAGPDRQEPVVLASTDHRISSFGEDDAGELYLTDLSSGELFRLVGRPR